MSPPWLKPKATRAALGKAGAAQKRERGTQSLPCPECGGKTAVLWTQRADRDLRPMRRRSMKVLKRGVYRQRQCEKCQHRFTTTEK